jgi:DNA-binding SARP family transcriptional activator
VDRALGLLEAVEAPVVQVWGWPGSGRAEILGALLERGGAWPLKAVDLTADLEASGRREEAVGAAVADGARWLVVPGLPAGADPAEVAGAVAELLPADRRLVFATRRRVTLPGHLCALVTPRELVLRPAEVAELLERAGIKGVGPGGAAALTTATDGWYRPILLAARAVGAEGRVPEDPEGLVALPAVADFLRLEVLADLPPEERAVLARGGAVSGPEAEPVVRRLVEEWGLLLETPQGLRPPRLLAAFLERSGRPGSRRAAGRPAEGSPETSSGAPRAAELPVEPPATARFRLHLLGRPEAWRRDEGGEWRRLHWPLRRALAVLAYLASSPERRAARAELEAAVWAEAGPEAVRKNFHPTLSHLRRGLEGGARGGIGEPEAPPLLLVDGVYALSPELGWWIDLEELERLAERGRALAERGRDEEAVAAWQAAWRLYRGELLAGSGEAWVVARREVHQRRHLRVLQELAGAYERLERPAEAIDAYRALLAEDALQERVHLALMRLYGRQARRDLVRRQYERLSALLLEGLDAEPLPETAEEYHRLMTERG